MYVLHRPEASGPNTACLPDTWRPLPWQRLCRTLPCLPLASTRVFIAFFCRGSQRERAAAFRLHLPSLPVGFDVQWPINDSGSCQTHQTETSDAAAGSCKPSSLGHEDAAGVFCTLPSNQQLYQGGFPAWRPLNIKKGKKTFCYHVDTPDRAHLKKCLSSFSLHATNKHLIFITHAQTKHFAFQVMLNVHIVCV